MTDQEMIVACAELDGLHKCVCNDPECGAWFEEENTTPKILPLYLTSRDAIIPLIEKQTSQALTQIYVILDKENPLHTTAERFVRDIVINALLSTPKQLATALLKATGKWKD